MNCFGVTDIGKKREANEDCFCIADIATNARLAVVCDGMGGEAGGALASSLAMRSFISEVKLQSEDYIKNGAVSFIDEESDVPMLLDGAVGSANYEVWQKAQDEPELKGMGTTLVAVLILTDPLRVWTVNIGDSRIYRVNGSSIEQMTKDHSYIQYLVDTGAITEKEAEKRTDRNIITRAVGISVQVMADIKQMECKGGDKLLLCSDGLYGMLDAAKIKNTMERNGKTAEENAKELVALANGAGGDDNITAVIVEL